MQERKEISKHPFQNYMCPSLDTPKAELGEELSFTNSVISVLINIDLNFLVIQIKINLITISRIN